jgi:hypothetical protein
MISRLLIFLFVGPLVGGSILWFIIFPVATYALMGFLPWAIVLHHKLFLVILPLAYAYGAPSAVIVWALLEWKRRSIERPTTIFFALVGVAGGLAAILWFPVVDWIYTCVTEPCPSAIGFYKRYMYWNGFGFFIRQVIAGAAIMIAAVSATLICMRIIRMTINRTVRQA